MKITYISKLFGFEPASIKIIVQKSVRVVNYNINKDLIYVNQLVFLQYVELDKPYALLQKKFVTLTNLDPKLIDRCHFS